MRHSQEDEIEFRFIENGISRIGEIEYPRLLGMIIYSYGGTIEDTIKKARERFGLDARWQVFYTEKSKA